MNWKLCNTGLLILALAGTLIAGGRTTAQKSGSKDDKPLTKETAMLAKVFFKYHDMDALSQKMHGKMTVHMGGVDVKVDFDSTLIAAQPDKFRITSKVTFFGEEKHGSVYSDGKNIWDWDQDAKQYSLQPGEAIIKDSDQFTNWVMDRSGLDMTLLFFLRAANNASLGLPAGVDKVNLDKYLKVRNYPAKAVDGTMMYLVPIPLDEKNPGKKGESMVLYVDTKSLLVRRVRMNVKLGDEKHPQEKGTMEMIMFYDSIKSDIKPTDQDFTFMPPEDATKVDAVKPVFTRAFDK